MSEPFIAEIVIFAGNFAPRSWAFCDGQLLPIAQNTALFSLIGTIYGGDGRTTFALPDLRGRAPIGPRTGPGLPNYREGETGGTPTNTLVANNLPQHTHAARGNSGAPNEASPAGGVPANSGAVGDLYNTTGNVDMAQSGNNATANAAVNNMQPYLAINYIIALQGVFPSRN